MGGRRGDCRGTLRCNEQTPREQKDALGVNTGFTYIGFIRRATGGSIFGHHRGVIMVMGLHTAFGCILVICHADVISVRLYLYIGWFGPDFLDIYIREVYSL